MRDWLAQRAASTPDAEALVAAATGTTWTYAELDEAVEKMAGSLAALGLSTGDRLGVFLDTRVEYVTLVHAAMRLGLRPIPVSDRLTDAELAPRLERADVTAVLCGAATEQRAVEAATTDDDGLAVPVVSLDEPQWKRVTHLRAVEQTDFEPHDWDRSEPLLSLFTSGSTGEPKLVVLRVGNVLSSAVTLGFRLGVHPDDRYLLTLSPHHTGGIMPLYRAVLAGTSVVLRTEFDPGAAADDLRTYDATGVSLVPTMLERMLDARGTLADSLRVVLLGGAPAPERLIERCRDYSVPVHPTYGMTEAASGITVATPQEAFDRPSTVGRPLVWTDVSVRDDDGEELPPGEVGELVVDGPSVTTGYYDDPTATGDAFGPHGLRTGDVGYRDEEGYVYVLNRKDDRIVTGGENVDPGEVLDVLGDHPHVTAASVVGVPDDEWGERVAALVVRSEPSMTAGDLETFARERLAGFKIPKTIRFTDALPRTDSGSVRRPEVRERLAAAAESTIGDADTTSGGDDDGVTTDTTSDDDSATADNGDDTPDGRTTDGDSGGDNHTDDAPANDTPDDGSGTTVAESDDTDDDTTTGDTDSDTVGDTDDDTTTGADDTTTGADDTTTGADDTTADDTDDPAALVDGDNDDDPTDLGIGESADADDGA